MREDHQGGSEGCLPESKHSITRTQRNLSEGSETLSMQADKLSKGAPGHPSSAYQSQPVKTDIPHDDVSRKQSDVQKQNPVPTQIKQGITVTLKQVNVITSAWPPRMPAFVHDHSSCTDVA